MTFTCPLNAEPKRKRDNVSKIVDRHNEIAVGISNSVRRFVHALHDAGGNGRYPDKIRQALQVISTAVCRAAALSKTKITFKEVGDALGLDPAMISKCQARFDALDDGEWEQLFDTRGARRSDQMREEWVEFARQFWEDPELADENDEAYNFTRRAEATSAVVRDPSNRKSGDWHRIHWLEESIVVMFTAMLERGKTTFGDDFHMSWPFFLDLRPFYVKDATRQTCMCVYHLRFEEMASGLLTYRRTLRREKISNCSCQIPANSRDLRRHLICPKRNGPDVQNATLDNRDCILQRCVECKDLQKLMSGPCGMCDEETRDTGSETTALKVKYESYEKITYTTKDGTEKDRKDFVSVVRSFSEFKSKLEEYWPKFIAHHNDAKWHDDDFVSLKNSLKRGHVAMVIDFAENYSHQPRFEHQSKYFSQVQTTIVPVVVMFRIEDLLNVSEAERQELLELFDKHALPHVVTETHFLISSDMQHDNAFIQKGFDDHVIPYITSVASATTVLHIRSDGCKV